MRILSDLVVSGLIFVPEINSEQAVSSSWVSRSLSLSGTLDPFAIYKNPGGPPLVVDTSSFSSGSGTTPIKCGLRNVLSENSSSAVTGSAKSGLNAFYNCFVSASRVGALSNFNLSGLSVDVGGEYSGSSRQNFTTLYSGSNEVSSSSNTRITHNSRIETSGSYGFGYYVDFILDLNTDDVTDGSRFNSTLTYVLPDCNLGPYPNYHFERIAEKFKKIFCNCLKNGEVFGFNVNLVCRNTGKPIDGGFIKFEKCFGKCTVTAKFNPTTGGKGLGLYGSPDINKDTKIAKSVSGFEIPWQGTSFGYEISMVTGSQPVLSGSGILTASFTPYMAIPSAPATPTTYYPFSGALTGSQIQFIPGLIYFDTLNSALHVYNGSGSWTAVSGGGGVSKFTQEIGDESASTFIITHSKNTRDVIVTVRETATPYEIVYPIVKATTPNTIEVDFGGEIPLSNEYTVIVV